MNIFWLLLGGSPFRVMVGGGGCIVAGGGYSWVAVDIF